MSFSKSNFKFIKKYYIDQFGKDTGEAMFHVAENKLLKMIDESDYKNNKAIEWHMKKNMLPTIALYLTFKEFECSSKNPYENTAKILEIVCKETQKKNRVIGSMPFGYKLFKLFCRTLIAKQYPIEGWHTEWVQYNNKEIHFNFTSCIYVDITKKYGCLELCPLFCANDDITLAGYSPNIIFERSETIGTGHNKCDFHFVNGKYR